MNKHEHQQLETEQDIERLEKRLLESRESMSIEWDEPTPGFYISEIARNTIVYHYAISGKQNFSKKPQGDCVVPVYFTHPPARPLDTAMMDADRACYFMRRFKHEEKMLGPNEQAALDYVIAMLEQP